MPSISVILPTCDRPDLLGRAVESVLAQTWTDFELLLVDSNRRCPPLRGQAEAAGWLNDPRVRVIDGIPVAHSSAARNAALARASGEWIAYLDDDDFYRPEKLERQLALARSSGSPLVSCGFEVWLPRRRCIRQSQRSSHGGDELLLDAVWRPQVLLHRRDSLRFFTADAGDDMHYTHAFLARHDLRVVPNVAQALVVVDQRHTGHVFANREAAWRSFRRTVRKFGPRYSRPARRLCLLRGMIFRAQGGHGSWGSLLRLLWAAWRQDRRAWRLALNSVAYRVRWLRPYVVRA